MGFGFPSQGMWQRPELPDPQFRIHSASDSKTSRMGLQEGYVPAQVFISQILSRLQTALFTSRVYLYPGGQNQKALLPRETRLF